MNNADLVWRLVELLLQKEKDLNQVALDKANNHKPNDHKQDDHKQDDHKQDEA